MNAYATYEAALRAARERNRSQIHPTGWVPIKMLTGWEIHRPLRAKRPKGKKRAGNPASRSTVRLKNFTGTVLRKSNGQVVIRGRKK